MLAKLWFNLKNTKLSTISNWKDKFIFLNGSTDFDREVFLKLINDTYSTQFSMDELDKLMSESPQYGVICLEPCYHPKQNTTLYSFIRLYNGQPDDWHIDNQLSTAELK